MLSAFSKIQTPYGAPSRHSELQRHMVNELGSKMELRVSKTGEVAGTYRTAVGNPPKDEESDLRGFASGDLLAFTVNFGVYGSLTSWAGQHTEEDQGAVIKSMWILARNIEDQNEPGQLWGAVLTGYNNFTR
jgi:hypothetical protein